MFASRQDEAAEQRRRRGVIGGAGHGLEALQACLQSFAGIVHARQIVMHEAVGMHQLDRSCRWGTVRVPTPQGGTAQAHQRGSQALATAEHRVGHGLVQRQCQRRQERVGVRFGPLEVSKIEPDPSDPRYIFTERGLGYRFLGGCRRGDVDRPAIGRPR